MKKQPEKNIFIFKEDLRSDLRGGPRKPFRLILPKLRITSYSYVALGAFFVLLILHIIFLWPHPAYLLQGSSGTTISEDALPNAVVQFEKLAKLGISDEPELQLAKGLERISIDNGRSLRGIQEAITKTVATNSIFKNLTIGDILIQRDTKQITLENVKVQNTTEDTSAGQSSIALAASFADALEKSPYFKDVNSSTLSVKNTIEGGTSSQRFTPIALTMTYQDTFEPNKEDEHIDFKNELQELLSPLSASHE